MTRRYSPQRAEGNQLLVLRCPDGICYISLPPYRAGARSALSSSIWDRSANCDRIGEAGTYHLPPRSEQRFLPLSSL